MTRPEITHIDTDNSNVEFLAEMNEIRKFEKPLQMRDNKKAFSRNQPNSLTNQTKGFD